MRHIILPAMMALVSFCVYAEGRFSTHINEVTDGYDFILYEPDSVSTALPLIITLHSRSAAGKNLDEVDRFGTIDALHSGMTLDAVVIAPQATGDKWNTRQIMRDVDWVIANRNIDRNRIYAIGMSMGGNGTADLAATYPYRIAAAIVLAGTLTLGNVTELNKLPLWVIRGQNDREEAIVRTDRMISEMRSQPDKAPRLVYSKVNGLDHRQHERLLYMPCFYQWLMSHNLNNPGRSVNTTPDVTTDMIKDSYNGLSLRDESSANRKSGPRRSQQRSSRHSGR